MAIPFQSEENSHKQYLLYQIEIEKNLKAMHIALSDKLTKIIMRNADNKGMIDKYKIKKIVDEYVGAEMKDYRKLLTGTIRMGVVDSANFGIRTTLAAVKPSAKVTAEQWTATATRIRNKILDKRSIDGLTLSDRIWKISDDNVLQLKKIIAGDILQGTPASTISQDVRKFLIQPESMRGAQKDLLHPGAGVYKSAYKNAMRVTRTETNRAYIDGQKATAKAMGYKLMLKLSKSHPEEDICDEFEGQVFDPEDFPAPLHPHCMCYGLNVPA